MDIRLTHETRGICLSALSGSAVTSGSYESGVLWLTNTQIVILDSIHLWCFAGVVTNNVKCQRMALILAHAAAPGWGGWWGSVLVGVSGGLPCSLGSAVTPWGTAGHLGNWNSPVYAFPLCVCCRGESALLHGWWGAAIHGESGWCSLSPKLFMTSRPPFPTSICVQVSSLVTACTSCDEVWYQKEFCTEALSMGGIGATRVRVMVGVSAQINAALLMPVSLPRLV